MENAVVHGSEAISKVLNTLIISIFTEIKYMN